MSRKWSCAVAVAVTVFAATGTVWAQESPTEASTSDTDPKSLSVKTSEDNIQYVPGELVVVEKGGPKEDNVKVVPVEEQTLEGLKKKAGQLESSRSSATIVEPNYVGGVNAVPNDDYYDHQYYLPQIGVREAWNHSLGAGTRICITDTGYDRTDPDLKDKVVAERDFVDGDSTAQDTRGRANGHGTHVAGIAAAETDNGFGTAGVGWKARLVIAKVVNSEARMTSADLARGIDFCQKVGGVSVVNMSVRLLARSAAVESEIRQSYSAYGFTLVAGVGNNGRFETQYPVGYPNVIGVGASVEQGSLWAGSNLGPTVDLVAPGTGIWSSGLGPGLSIKSGTSMSSPQVAGAAALLHEKGLKVNEVRARLFNNAEDRGPRGHDRYWGHGFLNVKCAVSPNENGCPPR